MSDLTTPDEVNAIIQAEEGAVVAFINRVYEVIYMKGPLQNIRRGSHTLRHVVKAIANLAQAVNSSLEGRTDTMFSSTGLTIFVPFTC